MHQKDVKMVQECIEWREKHIYVCYDVHYVCLMYILDNLRSKTDPYDALKRYVVNFYQNIVSSIIIKYPKYEREMHFSTFLLGIVTYFTVSSVQLRLITAIYYICFNSGTKTKHV